MTPGAKRWAKRPCMQLPRGFCHRYQGIDLVAKIPLDTAPPNEVTKMMRAAKEQQHFDHGSILKVIGVYDSITPPIILLELAEVCGPGASCPACMNAYHSSVVLSTNTTQVAGFPSQLEGVHVPHHLFVIPVGNILRQAAEGAVGPESLVSTQLT